MTGLLVLLAIALTLGIAILTTLIVVETRRPPRHTAGYAVAKGLPCDPGEMGLAFEAWELDLPGGASLPVWEIPGESPPGGTANSNITAIFIHGWGHSRIDTLRRIELFRAICNRVVLYDLRGHGESEGSLSMLGAGEYQDLIALVERLGENRFLFVGHSLGAMIAINAATSDVDIAPRIAGIITYGLHMGFHSSLQQRLRTTGYPARPLTDLAMLWFRLMGIRHRNLWTDIKLLNCPLLIVHGTDDVIAPYDDAVKVAREVSNATLHTVQGAGHLDTHLVDEEAHNAVVSDFVEGLEQSH